MKINKRVGMALLVTAAGLFAAVLLVRIWGNTVSAKDESYEGLQVFTEVLSVLQKSYVEPVKNKELIDGAINGMLGTLDPYSSYMLPEVYKESQVDTKGEFGGLGLQVGMQEKRVVVIAPIEGTPAMRAGILAGDIIVKVDDFELKEGVNLLEAVHRMRGPKGTKITLVIRRKGEKEPIVYELTRETIRVDSVKSKVIEEGIGYIRLTQFQERSASDLTRALSKLQESKIHSLILDLRNNPGGLLAASVKITEQFLENGKLIVSVKGRDGQKNEFIGEGNGDWKDIPMIVLVNKGSASASEIVSGALQDYGRAVILGTPTFGKGSVQTILPLSDGSALRLTTAKYYTPNGRSIHDLGIRPDIIVELEEQAKTPKTLHEGDPEKDTPKSEPKKEEKPGESGEAGEAEVSDQKIDNQLQKAIDLLKSFKIFSGGKRMSPSQLVEEKGNL